MATLRFVPAMGGTQYIDFHVDSGLRVSGDRRDGVYVTTATLPKYAAHGRWYVAQILVSDNANNSMFGGGDTGVPPSEVPPSEVAPMAEPLYFVNGEDSGAVVVPLPEEPDQPMPMPPEGGAADETPWANELRLPALGE